MPLDHWPPQRLFVWPPPPQPSPVEGEGEESDAPPTLDWAVVAAGDQRWLARQSQGGVKAPAQMPISSSRAASSNTM